MIDEADFASIRAEPEMMAYYLAGVARALFEKGDARVCRASEHGLTEEDLARFSVRPVRSEGPLYREDVLRIVEKLVSQKKS